jgi:predicted transcriptional regulator of viral defense system
MSTTPTNQALFEALFEIADDQAGYFTARQAMAAGLSQRQLSYYAETGRIERVRKGVYRLKQYPSSPHEDLFLWSLSLGRRAVFSHETALTLYDLSDVLPSQIHATVPRTASRRRPAVRLHTRYLPESDVTEYAGLPVTTVPRTLADVADAGLADELVMQAAQEAVRRGLVTGSGLRRYARSQGGRLTRLIERVLGGEP